MDRIKNIFVTGEINAGKSTILNKVINDLDITSLGFVTLPFVKNNRVIFFYMKQCNSTEVKNETANIIGREVVKGRWEGVTETFDTIGSEIINKSLESNGKIILMDELGFFESNATNFQKAVFKALDSKKIVLGAIKYKSTEFLDKIRKRKDVIILEITEESRESQYEKLKELVNQAIAHTD